ncbi:MAG: GAF domain-containing protein [Anaerolineae bacterium]|nr:GAF domain-containing protein [Anaerolineae bacterium]
MAASANQRAEQRALGKKQYQYALSLVEALLNSIPDLVFYKDEDGAYLGCNSEFALHVGRTVEEIVGKTDYDLYSKEDADAFRRNDRLMLEGGAPRRNEEWISYPDGRRVLLDTLKAPLFDPGGDLIGVVGISRDITERKQMEDDLRMKSRLLDAVREAQSLYIAQGDPRPVFDALLRTLISMTDSEFGFLDEVLHDRDGTPYKLSLSISNIAWDSESEALYEQLRARNLQFRNLNNLAGLPALIEEPVITNDAPHDPRAGGVPAGHPPIRSFMGLPVRVGGEVLGVIGVANRPGGYGESMALFLEPYVSACASIIQAVRLRSGEREAVDALRESQARLAEFNQILSGVLEHTHMMAVFLDPHFNFVWVNRAYAASCKREPDYFPGRNHFELYPHAENQAIFQRVVDTGEPFFVAARPFEFPDQPERGVTWWDWSLIPVKDEAGKVAGLVFTLVEVTERKQVEEGLLRAYKQLEALWKIASLVEADSQAISDHILATLTEMTDSRYGFFGYMNDDEAVMTIHSWSGGAMKDCQIVDAPLDFVISECGVWAEAVRQRAPLILNDFAAPHRGKRGLPAGHVALRNLLVVPFFSKGKIVSVAAVGNKHGTYGEADVRQITAFLSGIQNLVERRNAEEALRRSEIEYKALAKKNEELFGQARRDAESKAILLHEVNHRVKNNLMAVSGLLHAQQRFVREDLRADFQEAMKTLAGRIEAMAMAHSMLSATQWEPLALSRLCGVIMKMVFELVPEGRRLIYAFSGADANIPAVTVNSLALLLFELATNTVKHALPDQGAMPVYVSIKGRWTERGFAIEYRDTGPGYPEAVLTSGQVSLGLYLVRTLVTHDLRGEVSLRNDSGAVVDVRIGPDAGIRPMR